MAEFAEVMKRRKEMCDYYFKAEDCRIDCPLSYRNSGEKVDCHEFCERYYIGAEEIIMRWEKPVNWAKIEVDTPILVRGAEDCSWVRRYFAKYEGGFVYAWKEGATSWSASDAYDYVEWKYAKLSDAEGEQNE